MTKRENLNFNKARSLLFRPGTRLQKTKVNGRDEFAITPNGGPVTEHVAQQLLDHPNCRVADPGLFPGCPQSWGFASSRFATYPALADGELLTRRLKPTADCL